MMTNLLIIAILILSGFNTNTQSQNNKTKENMEPKILLIGRSLDVMEILKNELTKFNRNVVYANSNEMITDLLKKGDIDLIVVGAGLPDETREEMKTLIMQLQAEISLFMIERTPDGNPAKMIGFTNEKAVLWKIEKIIGKMPKRK
jgi:PleD family two-component response regulator